MLAVRQLDTSMANLRKWLSDIEHELSTPLYFMKTEEIEFKTKLGHQKVTYLVFYNTTENTMIIKLVND